MCIVVLLARIGLLVANDWNDFDAAGQLTFLALIDRRVVMAFRLPREASRRRRW